MADSEFMNWAKQHEDEYRRLASTLNPEEAADLYNQVMRRRLAALRLDDQLNREARKSLWDKNSPDNIRIRNLIDRITGDNNNRNTRKDTFPDPDIWLIY
jgi:ABC-type nitrate/sulfonate/bicarbonate transport system substrate-binding protein